MPRYKKNIDVEKEEFILRVGPEGRVVIPAPMRRALGLRPGVRIRGKIVETNKVILSPSDAITRIQDFAVKKGLDKMTMEEINRIIADHRKSKSRRK